MGITTSMGTNKLEVRKGDRQSIVDYVGTLDSTAPTADVVAGRVYTLTAGGKLTPGLQVGKLPYFAISGLDTNNYPDVQRDRGMPNNGASAFGTVAPHAAAELSTTAFKTDDTYNPGDALTAYANTGANGKRGLILKRVTATDPIVGFVAPAGNHTSPDGVATLAFYPDYTPGTTVTAQP